MSTPEPKPPKTVYFTMVHSPQGVKRVGNAYGSKKAAREWTQFLASAWNGMRVSVRSCVITYGPDGTPDTKSRKRLSEEFNLDV
jgi:hypothetical protein